jgi:hypothetical protein
MARTSKKVGRHSRDGWQTIMVDHVRPDQLISWLNSKAGTRANAPVARIIELLQNQRDQRLLATARTDAERQRIASLITPISPRVPDELHELLFQYWVSPLLVFSNDGNPQLVYRTTPKARGKVDLGEIAAVMCVMHLGLRDEFERVRKCSCGKFFFARRLDQLYCTTTCRVKYHQSSAQFKAKRRKYQREWYHLKKSGKVK